jgi:hypothetical protein
MTEILVKGATLNYAVAAFKELAGDSRFAAGVMGLSDDAQRVLKTPPTFSEWVAMPTSKEIYDYAFVLFANDAHTMQQSGRRAAVLALKGAYKIFVRVLSPQRSMRSFPTIWSLITKGWGVGKVLTIDTGEATISMTGLAGNSPAVWHFVSGLLLGLAEVSGGKSCSCAIVKGGGTSDECHFLVRW